MFGRRCTLCGGKLNSRNICKECGLDNTKSKKTYVINHSDCEHKPMTHVHPEKDIGKQYKYGDEGKKKQTFAYRRDASDTAGNRTTVSKKVTPSSSPSSKKMSGTSQNRAYTYTEDVRPKKKKTVWKIIGIIVLIYLLILCIGVAVTMVAGAFRDGKQEGITSHFTEKRENPYDYLENEDSGAILQEDGESVEYELTSGNYIVGVHIPEGNYRAETEYDFDVVRVRDVEHNIYLYEYQGMEEENMLDDLRLFDGAFVQIHTDTKVTLRSDNAQADALHPMENPLKEEILLSGGDTYVSGTDFEPGIYDVHTSGDYLSATVEAYDGENGDYMGSEYLLLDNENGQTFHYLVLPKGATIKVETESKPDLLLIPSEWIASTDYEEFYRNY